MHLPPFCTKKLLSARRRSVSSVITVAITLIIPLAVATAFLIGAVVSHAEYPRTNELQLMDRFAQKTAAVIVPTNHHQYPVGLLGRDQRITDLTYRRKVRDDVVIGFMKGFQHFRHPHGTQKFHRVWRICAGGDDMKRFYLPLDAAQLN